MNTLDELYTALSQDMEVASQRIGNVEEKVQSLAIDVSTNLIELRKVKDAITSMLVEATTSAVEAVKGSATLNIQIDKLNAGLDLLSDLNNLTGRAQTIASSMIVQQESLIKISEYMTRDAANVVTKLANHDKEVAASRTLSDATFLVILLNALRTLFKGGK